MVIDTSQTQTDLPVTLRSVNRAGSLPWHIVALVAIALLQPIVPIVPFPIVRVSLGLVLALGSPGYALTVALFPHPRDLDRLTRVTLSFGLSIAVIPMLTLFLNALPSGIQPWSMTISLSLWTSTMAMIAIWRQRAIERSDITLEGVEFHRSAPRTKLRERLTRRHLLGIGLISGTFAIAMLAVPLIQSSTVPTEFYVLGSGGLAEQYPREVTPDDDIVLTVGIMNGEPDERNYWIEVWVSKAPTFNRLTLLTSVGPTTLRPHQRFEQPVSFRMPSIGDDQRVEYLLFRAGDQQPFRRLELWLNVVDVVAE